MRKHLLLTVAALTLTATGVWAADNAPKADNSMANGASAGAGFSDNDKGWTLDQGRQHAHERAKEAQEWAEKVDKMTEAEWAEHEKKWHDSKEKLAKMTPEEKKEYWHKKKEKHEEKVHAENSKPIDKGNPAPSKE